MTSKWYNSNEYQQVLISKFLNLTDKKPQNEVLIIDQKIIKKILEFLDVIPTSGEKYKSFADETELLTIKLCNKDQADVIEFYDGMLKTPATSILSSSNEKQIGLYNLLQELFLTERTEAQR